MIPGNKKGDLKDLKEQVQDLLSGINVDNELESEEAVEIFNELNKSDAFNQEIDEILSILNEKTLDLTTLQTKIMIILKKYLSIFNSKKLPINIDERLVTKTITEISGYLMLQRSKLIKESTTGLIKSKDGVYNINNKILKDTKRMIKNFAIYQIYKFINPKRIAGETKKENFANNYLKGGIDLAKKYEGGSKSDLIKYTPKFLKKLEQSHKNVKAGRGL